MARVHLLLFIKFSINGNQAFNTVDCLPHLHNDIPVIETFCKRGAIIHDGFHDSFLGRSDLQM